MPTTPPSSLLDRELSKADVREKIDLAMPLMREIVDNGLAVLMRCSIDAGAAAMKAEDEAILSLYRHLLVAVDGIQTVISEAAVEGCEPLLRTEFEALVSLLFIAEAPTLALRAQRGQAYVVADLKRQLGELKRLDPASAEGQQARAKLARDDYLKNVAMPAIPDLATRIAEVERRLNDPSLAAAESEFETLRNSHPRRKRPAWYELFGGPHSIENVADQVGMAGSYEFLYRMWSGFVHGTEAVRERRSATWRRVRSTTGLVTSAHLAVSFALRATRTVLPIYRHGENSYETLYKSEIRPAYRALTQY
jgi:hypothetical protein